MTKIKAYLTLIRWPNLLIMALIFAVLRYGFLVQLGFDVYLNTVWHILFVLATLLIAAGGNAVNDAFDVKADAINKPEKQVVGVALSKETALFAGQALMLAGVGIGLMVGYVNQIMTFSYIYILCAVLLWLYASTLKRKPIIGNLLIALLAAILVCTEIVFDLLKSLTPENKEMHISGMQVILGVAAFAFITTLIRELIKDLQDIEGDRAAGYKTLPVTSGQYFPKILVIFLVMFTIAAVGAMVWFTFAAGDYFSPVYLILFVIVPLLFVMMRIAAAGNRSDYGKLSAVMKLTMVAGILSIVVFTAVFKWSLAKAREAEEKIPPPEEWIIQPAA